MDSDNTLKRRDFLGHTSAVAIAGVASLNGVGNTAWAGESSSRLDCSHFEDLVGDTFTVSDQSTALKLVDATASHPRDARPAHVRQRPFSLLFAAPEGTELADAIHRVNHRRLGRFDVFVQRVRTESHANSFEVTFS